MPYISTGKTSLSIGTHLLIGYRRHGSAGPFSYLPAVKADNLPFRFEVEPGLYDVEYTVQCPNCSGITNSDPIQISVSVT